jgi:large subunit ribosomal protein L21
MEPTSNTSYAVVKSGGKQYRVSQGSRIRVEKLENAKGDEIRFSDVLLVKDGDNLKTGTPTVSGAVVVGTIARQMKDKKVLVFKKRSKKGYKKLRGHRQNLTEVVITSIQAGN